MGKNKRSKSYYIRCAKRQKKGSVLEPDMVGFLCTCNSNERDCVREAYNILNEFADRLYGKESQDVSVADSRADNAGIPCKEDPGIGDCNKLGNEDPASSSEDESFDIEAAIKVEVSVLKDSQNQRHPRRFQQVVSGAKNCVFIRTTLKDPLPLSLAIMDDIFVSKKQRTQKLLRMTPVQQTCKAYPDDIKKAVQELASSYFKENGKTFCIVIKVRNNTSIKNENIVYDLATILETANPNNKPSFNTPEVILSVDIIRNVCCLGFLPNYYKYCKYNLVVLAKRDEILLQKSLVNKVKVSEELECNKEVDDAASGNCEADTDSGEKVIMEANVESENGTVSVEKDEPLSQKSTEKDNCIS